jgi:CO/xanthine dehydrogenase Mo-binding subunit
MIMGLGTAQFEAIDAVDGQIANPNLSDYEIPAFADLPR